MQIFNVRFGLATNSSSSHSMIFLKEGVKAFDYLTGRLEEHEFGWQNFILASDKAKMHYLAAMLKNRLFEVLPIEIAQLICKDWLDVEFDAEGSGIDHQSLYLLPNSFNTKLPDRQFIDALKNYFLKPNFAILGGNDNQSSIHTLDEGDSFKLPLPRDIMRDTKMTCRYDADHDYWTIFREDNGTKIRFRLSDDPTKMQVVPDKAYSPELIDIKITDFCPYGCSFCYQSSTTAGKHCPLGHFYRLAYALEQMKVFEVALGGGEPTLHPNFVDVLRVFRDRGIVPNFTTRNMNWLRDPKKWTRIMEYTGAFALSVSNGDEIEELATLLDYNGIPHHRANLHLVMGTLKDYEFRSLLKLASVHNISVTLLGYKNFGFGQNQQPIPYDWWLTETKGLLDDDGVRVALSIDTVLAQQYERQILEAEIPSWLFTTQDGKFSAYIDAVNQKIGPSSFCEESKMREVDIGNNEELLAAFRSF